MNQAINNGFIAIIVLGSLTGWCSAKEDIIGGELLRLEKKVAVLLIDKTPSRKAWGAYLTAKHRLTSNIPVLIRMLNQSKGMDDKKNRALRRTIISALIDLRTEIKQIDISTLFKNQQHILALGILASRKNLKEDNLLPEFNRIEKGKEVRDMFWMAICNFLTKTRNPNIAERLIRNTQIKISIKVSDPNLIMEGKRHSIVMLSDGSLKRIDAFPPQVYYDLRIKPQPGDVVLAPGPESVYLYRREASDACLEFRGVHHPLDRHAYRLRCLTALLFSTPENEGLQVKPSFTLIWRDKSKLLVDAKEQLEKIKKNWKELAEQLLEKELWQGDELSRALPYFTISVNDTRRIKTPELPRLQGLLKNESYKEIHDSEF